MKRINALLIAFLVFISIVNSIAESVNSVIWSGQFLQAIAVSLMVVVLLVGHLAVAAVVLSLFRLHSRLSRAEGTEFFTFLVAGNVSIVFSIITFYVFN